MCTLIVTDIAVMAPTHDVLVLKEIAPGWSVEEVQSITAAHLIVTGDVKEYEL